MQLPSILLKALIVCFAYFATMSSSQGVEKGLKSPNIVLIMADDLGYTDLACYGNKWAQTPNIDRLARDGIKFTDGYAASPVCTPTRASIMTGLSPARLKITNHAPGNPNYISKTSGLKGADWTTFLPLETNTLAERLQNSGYRNGFIGKWHLSHIKTNGRFDKSKELSLRPENQGFELNVGGCSYGGPPSFFEPYKIPAITPEKDGDYLPDRLADECIKFIDMDKEGPFFLCWWNYSVHYPIEAPLHLIEKYKQIPGVDNPAYQAMIEGMDMSVGRVIDHIDSSGLAEDTLIIFTSDNGSLFNVNPLRANKGHLYEGGIRVPWIFRWTGKTLKGRVESTPIVSMDLFPTLLGVANTKIEKDYVHDGIDLTSLLVSDKKIERDSLYFHYPNFAFHKKNRLGSAIREGGWKLIYFYDKSESELFDLKSDYIESTNVAAEFPEIATRLKKKLLSWLEESKANLPTKP